MRAILQLKKRTGEIELQTLMMTSVGHPILPARGDEVIVKGIRYTVTHNLWVLKDSDASTDSTVTVFAIENRTRDAS